MSTEPFEKLHELLHSDVVFAKLTLRTLIEVTGEDRARFMHNLCTNEINNLQPGQGCEAFFTTVQGKILLHASLYCQQNSIVIDAVPNQAATILPHLDKYLITEDVTLVDRTDDWKQVLLVGPRAEGVLKGAGLPAPSKMLEHTLADNLHIRRVPFATVPCFLLQMPNGIDGWVEKLLNEGATAVHEDVVEAARIEATYPAYGLDITDANLPQEVGRDSEAISFTKGCYLGQETVARIDALGHVNQYLVRLEFEDRVASESELVTEVEGESKVVGRVTSVTPNDGRMGLGYVRRTIIESNASLTCAGVSVRISS